MRCFVPDEIERRAQVLKDADRLLRLMAEINLAINLRRAAPKSVGAADVAEVTRADT